MKTIDLSELDGRNFAPTIMIGSEKNYFHLIASTTLGIFLGILQAESARREKKCSLIQIQLNTYKSVS